MSWRDSDYVTLHQGIYTCQPPRFAFALWLVRTVAKALLGALTAVSGGALMMLALRDASQVSDQVEVFSVGLLLVGLAMFALNAVALAHGVFRRIRRTDPLFTQEM